MVKVKETMQIGLVTVFVGGVQGVSGHPREGCPDTLNPITRTKLSSARVSEGNKEGLRCALKMGDHDSTKKPDWIWFGLPPSGCFLQAGLVVGCGWSGVRGT